MQAAAPDWVCVWCLTRDRDWRIGRNATVSPPRHFEPLGRHVVITLAIERFKRRPAWHGADDLPTLVPTYFFCVSTNCRTYDASIAAAIFSLASDAGMLPTSASICVAVCSLSTRPPFLETRE